MRARATSPGPDERSLEEIELQLLLEGIALHYGYDFRDYAPAPLRRNILMSMALEGVPTISAYQDRVLHDPASLQRFLNTVGVNVTSMFREAIAMRVLREEIVPWLRTFPSVRIWVAGCATGEEVASLAIVLRETEMLGRTRIYATDINEASLTIAARGLMPIESVQSGEEALAELKGQKFDVAVIDLGLPGMSGWEVIERIRSTKGLRSTALVVYTARDLNREEELIEAIEDYQSGRMGRIGA